jgi:hypothetical protein
MHFQKQRRKEITGDSFLAGGSEQASAFSVNSHWRRRRRREV